MPYLLDARGERLAPGDCYRYENAPQFDRIGDDLEIAGGFVRFTATLMELECEEDKTQQIAFPYDDRGVVKQSIFKVECLTCANLLTCTLHGEPKALEVSP